MTNELTGTQKRGLAWGDKADIDSPAYYDKSWAVVIGINNYEGRHPTLANAVSDAREMARVLKEDYGFDHVFTLYDQQANREEILGWLRDKLSGHVSPSEVASQDQVGANDRVAFFFAGHGTTQRSQAGYMRGYIIPQDARRGRYADYIDMSEMREACGWIPAKHILIILDCCFSGVAAVGAMADPSPSPYNLTDAYLKRITGRKAWQILTAGDQDELAADSGVRPGHSAFTGALLAGLEGLADHNQDKLITATDLANYIKPEVTRQTARAGAEGQSPFFNYLAGSGQGDFVFVRPGDKPIIQPASLVEAEVKPFLKQYPWALPAVGVLLAALLILGWLAALKLNKVEAQQMAYEATINAIYDNQTQIAREQAIAATVGAATSTAVANAPAAIQTAAAIQVLATEAAIQIKENNLNATLQALNELQEVTATSTPEPETTATPTATSMPTDTATATPTPTDTAAPTPSFTPRPPTATFTPAVDVQATQTAEARTGQYLTTIAANCSGGPQGEFRVYWEQYKGRLGCPRQERPTDGGNMALQEFERGFMVWSQVLDFVVTVTTSDHDPRWFFAQPQNVVPGSSRCINQYPSPRAELIDPISSFGEVWCDNKEIREAIGWGVKKERSVGAAIQEFEGGVILRDEDQSRAYVMFKDDRSYIRDTK